MKWRTPLNWFQMTWCLFSCPLLVWYLSEIQLLLLQLWEIDEQDLTFWSSLSVLNPQSLVSCCLELSFPFHLQICILFIGFSTIFSLYLFFLKYVSLLLSFTCIIFLGSTSTDSTHVPTPAMCLGAVLLGCPCVWLRFSHSTMLQHARRGKYFPVCFPFWPTSH